MKSNNQLSNSNNQVAATCEVVSEENTLFEENIFPQEQITFDSTSLDDLFVAIEYDVSNNQPDPLAVGDTADIANLVSSASAARKRTIKIYHPFSHGVEELPEFSPSRSPDSFDQCLPPKISCSRDESVERQIPIANVDMGEVIVVSDDDSSVNRSTLDFDIEKTIARTQLREMDEMTISKKNKNTKNKTSKDSKGKRSSNGESHRKAVQSKASGTQTEPTNEIRRLNENENRSSLLVDQHDTVCVEEDTPDDVISVEQDTTDILMKELAQKMLRKMEERKLAASELRQKRMAENALAKQLVRQIMKPGQPCQVDHNSGSAEHSPPAPMTLKEQTNAEAALARQLVSHMSKGCSFEETIQALKSTTSSNVRPANNATRANQVNVSTKPVAGTPNDFKKRQQQMEGQSVPAKRLNRCNSNANSTSLSIPTPSPRPEASSGNSSSLQPALPSHSVAFSSLNRGNNKASTNKSFVGGQQILGEQSNSMPITNRMSSSLLSAVHPSHLLPTSSLITTTIVDELEDTIVPKVSDYFEQMNPLNLALPAASQYLEPSSSSKKPSADSLRLNTTEIGHSQLASNSTRHQAQLSAHNQLQESINLHVLAPNPTGYDYVETTEVDVSLDQLRSVLQQKLQTVQQLQRIRDQQRSLVSSNMTRTSFL